MRKGLAPKRGLYPPDFWSLGDRPRLERAIALYDRGEIVRIEEAGGRLRGRTQSDQRFEIDTGRPGRHFRCSCGVRSGRDRFPCPHATAGLIDWWREAGASLAAGTEASEEPPGLEPLGPIAADAAAVASFALLGRGLAQVRLAAEPDDPLSVTVELLAPDGESLGKLRPNREVALELLRDLPRRLGDDVRWTGKVPPARVSDDPAEWVVKVEEAAGGALAVERIVRLPGRSGKRRRTIRPESLSGDTILVDGVIYRLQEGPPPSVHGHVLEPGRRIELDGEELARFLSIDAPLLRARGLLDGDPDLVAAAAGESPRLERMTVDFEDGSFRVRPTFAVGDVELSLEDLEAARKEGWIRRGKQWLRVADNPLADLGLEGVETDDDGRLRLERAEFLRTRALLPDEAAVARSEAADSIERALLRFVPPQPREVAEAYLGTLRPYQKHGYDWLLFLRENGLPAVLADEMGLGKTHQILAYLAAVARESEGRPSLVVCPRTVLEHWLDRIEDFAPSLGVLAHVGSDRDLPHRLPGHGLVLTTYGLLARDVEVLSAIEWESVVLDEAQRIKNATTKTARAARALLARHRVAATGTPLENRLDELRSIFEFLLPGFFGSDDDFRSRFVRPIVAGDEVALARLRRLIEPFKLRRVKRDVLADLPPKTEDVYRCHLAPHQAALYRETLERKAQPLLAELRDPGKKVDYLHVFAVLSRLKRICDHPYLALGTEESRSLHSAKLDLFLEVLDEALESEEKVVVFSQYLEMLDLIAAALDRRGVRYVELRGATRARGEVVKKFQTDPGCRVFLGSLLAGGVGIDLTAATVVIHYDRWWNAAREDQATDRVHRIGQTAPVQVVNFVTRDTIEEGIDRLIRQKRSLFENVVAPDESTFKSFEREDLIELLGG